MPISRGDKCVFIHIPKCAGTSVEIALGVADDYPRIGLEPTSTRPNFQKLFGGGLQHLTAREVQKNFQDLWGRKDFSFAIVRDPVDRFISHFLWKHYRFQDDALPNLEMLNRFIDDLDKVRKFSQSIKLFSDPFNGMEFCEAVPNSVHLNSMDRHILPQCSYLFSSGTVAVDFVFDCSCLDALEVFLNQKGVLARAIPHVMTGKISRAFRQIIPDNIIEAILNIYSPDVRLVYAVRERMRNSYSNVCLGSELNELILPNKIERGIRRSKISAQRPFNIPRKLWLYWHQGWGHAPKIIRECQRSWMTHNPTWEIKLLDKHSLSEFIKLPEYYTNSLEMTPTALSDVIRIHLLAAYGGVWADATTWCARSLDEWVGKATANSGFFAYAKPGPDRPIASWFLASTAKNYISVQQEKATNRLWKGFAEKGSLSRMDISDNPLSKDYFWFHRLFGELLESNSRFKKIWSATPEISADAPHYLQHKGLLAAHNTDTEFHIRNRLTNVYKLQRRIDLPADLSGTVIGQLFSSL